MALTRTAVALSGGTPAPITPGGVATPDPESGEPDNVFTKLWKLVIYIWKTGIATTIGELFAELVVIVVGIHIIEPIRLWVYDNRCRVNINKADIDQLVKLGILPFHAERIIKHREEKGPFRTIDDVTKVPYLTDKTRVILEKRVKTTWFVMLRLSYFKKVWKNWWRKQAKKGDWDELLNED